VPLLGRFEDDEVGPLVDYWRQSASPGAVEALALMNKQIDVRHVLPAIRVPTLLLHGSEDAIVPIDDFVKTDDDKAWRVRLHMLCDSPEAFAKGGSGSVAV